MLLNNVLVCQAELARRCVCIEYLVWIVPYYIIYMYPMLC